MKGWYKREWAWRLANRKPLSTSGLIPEKLCVGEEEPHWCLPARFYSSSSISVWASRTGCPCSFCHFITPPSLCPPIKHLSQHVLGYMCVFGCIRSPAGCVNSGRRVKRERSLRSQSCGSSLAWPGCIHCLGGKTQSMYQTRLSPLLALCNQNVQMLTFPHLTSSSVSLSPAVLE